MILTEAFALGTPVVASDIAGYSDVVRDGVEGVLFARGDADALARTLLELAARPAAPRGDVGRRGASRARLRLAERRRPGARGLRGRAAIGTPGGARARLAVRRGRASRRRPAAGRGAAATAGPRARERRGAPARARRPVTLSRRATRVGARPARAAHRPGSTCCAAPTARSTPAGPSTSSAAWPPTAPGREPLHALAAAGRAGRELRDGRRQRGAPRGGAHQAAPAGAQAGPDRRSSPAEPAQAELAHPAHPALRAQENAARTETPLPVAAATLWPQRARKVHGDPAT